MEQQTAERGRTMHRLKDLREERFLSQAALAKLAGVSPATILKIEKGRSVPYGVTVRRLAQALGVDVAVFRPCAPPPAGAGAP